jgi:hypothetical protein
VSAFLSTTKSDLLSISRAPMFVAASGALVGTLFFISTLFVRIDVYHDAVTFHQFISIGIAVLNVALLWLTSGVALRLLRCILDQARFERMQLAGRLRAFNHLATVSLALALAAILRYAFFKAPIPAFGLQLLASPRWWCVFPLILLCTVSTVILLDPLLTLRSSTSIPSRRKPVAGTSILPLSLANDSEREDF